MTQSGSIPTDLLTVAEIAASMRVSKMTVYRLMRSGAMESIRFGRSYRVSETALQRYLETAQPEH
ncbi:DNA-binding protein [Arthrobacter cheniae]|uniref:DNA-binding protein n=1 Tax=Arthrobacter cheniae TaxID=1258888 RepID=A0A3A5M9D2_9MICC|nr:helix-turn-helix domain-containing protein [Arthrobacter cheniae]RJT75132.1 DNA-binding protein [Arthrobacter cheniae]